MKKNRSNADRIIRLVIVAAIAALYFTGTITGFLVIALLVAGAVFTLTSILDFCPIYAIFGLSACPVKKPAE